MVGGDYRIGAVALCFRRKAKHDPATDQAAYGRNEQQKPGMKNLTGLGQPTHSRFTVRTMRSIAGNLVQPDAEHQLTGNRECDCSKSSDQSHQHGQGKKTGLSARTLPEDSQEFREPVKRMGKRRRFSNLFLHEPPLRATMPARGQDCVSLKR